ncbi:MAG: hypothetical protein Tsb0019_31380 [Roseibium sp.]
MIPSDLETVYEALAVRLDAVGPENHALFLAKLALLLSHDLDDAGQVRARIDEAARDLDV